MVEQIINKGKAKRNIINEAWKEHEEEVKEKVE